MRIAVICAAITALVYPVAAVDEWPQFRGPLGDGHVIDSNVPLKWGEQQNVKWKSAVPGKGWSSPVIRGNQIWMQTAIDDGRSLRAVCVDRRNGKLIHNQEIFYVAEPAPIHKLNSHASPTPVLEGDRCYVFFGMYGAAAIDTGTGKILWRNDSLKHDHDENGPGSSPILHRDLLILTCDGTELRYLAALHKDTGKLAWRTPRSNDMSAINFHRRKAYHTPQVIEVDGREQLISIAAERVSAYEPDTGKEIWYVDIPGFSNVPRPVYGHGLVYIATGFMKPQLWAIDPRGRGDVTDTHVRWKVIKQAPAKPSPILVGQQLYMVSDGGILTALDATTGREIYQERLGGAFSASPILARGHLFFSDQEGRTVVVKPGDTLNIVAENRLSSGLMSSPAVAGDALFLRTETHLYRIEE
jgi:outer membrane protein assembly factor BamB